jgi:hypothetical protein
MNVIRSQEIVEEDSQESHWFFLVVLDHWMHYIPDQWWSPIWSVQTVQHTDKRNHYVNKRTNAIAINVWYHWNILKVFLQLFLIHTLLLNRLCHNLIKWQLHLNLFNASISTSFPEVMKIDFKARCKNVGRTQNTILVYLNAQYFP